MKRAFLAGSVLILALTACASETKTFEPVEGFITDVQRSSLTLKSLSGDVYEFDNADTEVTIAHLLQHKKQKLQVQITYESNGDRLIARSIVDSSNPGK